MQKFFIVLGAVFAAIVVIVGVFAAIAIPRTLKLDREATEYLQNAVPKIVEHWNAQELVDRATPQLMAATKSPNDLNRYFVLFSRLGALKHLDTPKGGIVSSAYSGQEALAMGNYTITADFEKGPATLSVQIRHVDEGWKINGFRVNSELLLPPQT